VARRVIRALGVAVVLFAGLIAGVVLFLNGEVPADATGNILKNASFETLEKGAPAGWSLDSKVVHKGTMSLSHKDVHSGESSLKLEPNEKNRPWDIGHDPFGVGQGFRAGSLAGKTLYLSAWMGAEGDAAAVVVAIALGGKVPVLAQLKQTPGESGLVYREDILQVPKDAKILVVVCSTQGTSGAAHFDNVFAGLRPPSGDFTRAPAATPADSGLQAGLHAEVVIDASKPVREIPRTLYGMNIEWQWDGNGLWNEKLHALDPDLVRLTRDLAPTLLRFPGGILSDFYHWRDGIGPQDHRPLTKAHPGDPDGSVHHLGTDEALSLADQVGAQLLITVNAGTGTAQEAADWVRYVNHDRRRVEYWEVGNEIYVKQGQPAFVKSTMPPDVYARKFVEFSKAMRAADPGIKIGAIGDESYGDLAPRAYGDWTSKVLSIAGKDMDFLAVHNGYAPILTEDKGWPLRSVYSAMLAAPVLFGNSLALAGTKIETAAPESASRIRLAVTEWGPYFEAGTNGRFVDHNKTLGAGLYVASALERMMESPRTDVATGFKLVDQLYQGWIGKRGDTWLATAPYYALQLFTHHFGSELVSSTVTGPKYDTQAIGQVDAMTAVPYLDVVSSRGGDRKLYVIGINRNFDQPIVARIHLNGYRPAASAATWTLNGTAIDANTGTQLFQAPGVKWARQESDGPNGRFNSGGPDEIKITPGTFDKVGETFEYSFPAHSITAFEISGH
jgi:alpha-L-arabinofuranosidase